MTQNSPRSTRHPSSPSARAASDALPVDEDDRSADSPTAAPRDVHLAFDARGPATPAAREFLTALIDRLPAATWSNHPSPKVRAETNAKRRDVAEAVLSTVASAFPGGVAYPASDFIQTSMFEGAKAVRPYTDKSDRYRNPAVMNKNTLPVIKALVDANVVRRKPGERGRLSTLRPSIPMLAEMHRHALPTGSFRRLPPAEIVVLKAARTRADKILGHSGELQPYEDTTETNAMRTRLRRINGFTRDIEVTLPDGSKLIDAIYSRRFNVDFTLNGRFYCHDVQSIKRDVRPHILLDGRQVTEMDYGQSQLRLLYWHAGRPAPAGDLYAVQGVPRMVAKKLALAMMYAGWRDRWPEGHGKLAKVCGYNGTLEAAQKAIIARHPAIAHLLRGDGVDEETQRRVSLRLCRLESEITEEVMLALTDAKVPFIAIHDSFVVPREEAQRLHGLMAAAWRRFVGTEPVITTTTAKEPKPMDRARILAEAASF